MRNKFARGQDLFIPRGPNFRPICALREEGHKYVGNSAYGESSNAKLKLLGMYMCKHASLTSGPGFGKLAGLKGACMVGIERCDNFVSAPKL